MLTLTALIYRIAGNKLQVTCFSQIQNVATKLKILNSPDQATLLLEN